MATSGTSAGVYAGRTMYNLYVVVSQHSRSGNSSKYNWSLRARNPERRTITWFSTPKPWSITIESQTWSGSAALDFRAGQAEIILATGTTGWFSHNSSGDLYVNWSASHNTAPELFGNASTSGGFTNSIGQVPPAPNISAHTPNPDQITTTSMRVRFTSTGDGGSPVTSWQLQRATNSAFTGATTVTSSGTTVFTGLNPGTTYYFRARGINAVGTGAWSATKSGATLPATPPTLSVAPSLSGTQAVLTLSGPSGISGVDYYGVERRDTGTTTPITIVPVIEGFTWTVSGLTPGKKYDWRAYAFIGSYQVPYSSWQTVTQPKPNTNPGDFFDGATIDTADVTYAWTGTANASTSTASSPTPTGWMTFLEGDDDSGGTGAVSSVVGGRSGGRSARVTFFTDTVTPGFKSGQSNGSLGRSDVEPDALYVGSIYLQMPGRTQLCAAEITWMNAAGTVVGSDVGEAVLVGGTTTYTRLFVAATSPSDAEFGSVHLVDVNGVGWSTWKSGNTYEMDTAMLTLGELFPYFDGGTADNAEFIYSWTGTPSASTSTRTPVPAGTVDLLFDPDCVVIPAPPQPPAIPDDCIDEVGLWRRYWAVIPADEVSDWLDVIPTLTLTTQAQAERQVRIRVYSNEAGTAPEDFDASQWVAEQIISYVPPNTVLTIDGVSERVWASVNGSESLPGDRLLYGTGGTPATWPVLSCGGQYLISFDVPTDAEVGNLSVQVALTRRF